MDTESKTQEGKDMIPEQLKFAMRNNSVTVSNYKLTSDNRIIK